MRDSSRSFKTPILFLVFNRPDVTQKVFNKIREMQPDKLYVAVDGPREGRAEDSKKIQEVLEIALSIDWPCEVKHLIRSRNLGCKLAVSEAISWFFEYEEKGIILEDDCLPNSDFFYFCENLLEYYAEDNQVFMITGNNFQNSQKRGNSSYYFSRYPHIWGWATWRRAWSKYDGDLRFWPEWKSSADWLNLMPDNVERKFWEKIFSAMFRSEIDTWDFPWAACIWLCNGLVATPNVNLVTNIGFGINATHTTQSNSQFARMEMEPLGLLDHPVEIVRDVVADRYVFDQNYGGKSLRFPYCLLGNIKKIISQMYRLIKIK